MKERNCNNCGHSNVCMFKVWVAPRMNEILDKAEDPIEVTVTCKNWTTAQQERAI